MKKIVVIGAGYAGILTAKKLEKKLKKEKDVEITLINKNTFHTMLTELHEVAAGRVDEESIRIELSDVFAHRNVNVIVDEVTSIDFENKKVVGNTTNIEYDYLVIGTGCKPTFYDVSGTDNIYTLWSYEDAVNLKHHIHDMFRRAKYEQDLEKRKKMFTFIVVGSGFTGVEMAGELAEYKKHLCYKYDVSESEVIIKMVEAGDKILPFYPEKLRAKVTNRLNKLGVEIQTNKAVCDVSEQHCKFDESSIVDTCTVIWAAGIQGSDLVQGSDISKTPNGRIKTNKYLQAEAHEDVYVVGDNIFYIPENSDQPVPQMVENAEHSSHTVAVNIVSEFKGTKKSEYKPTFHGSMVCVGGRWGAAYVGSKKMYSCTGFIAMFIKHFINVVYFMQVLGLHKVWSYVKHEFFTVKNNRSILGGHVSNAKSAPGFFLFPLRMLVGFLWFASGVTKLPKIFDDWRNVFLMPRPPAKDVTAGTSDATDAATAATGEVTEAVETATDAATAATGEVTEAVETATDAATAATGEVTEAVETATDAATAATGEVTDVVDSATDAVEQLGWFEKFAKDLGDFTELKANKPLPVPDFIEDIMEWSYKTFFWADDGTFTTFAAIVQSSMIFVEILIGIMFLLGLFTPIAAILSVAVMIVIYLSGWSYISILMFGLMSFACFFAGNVLGLDYYILPLCDKFLRKFKLTRKWYLYFKHE